MPYIWPSWTSHTGASPGQLLPMLIVWLIPAGLIKWDEGFLPPAFAENKLRRDWPSGQIIGFPLQCRYVSFMILNKCEVPSLNRKVIDINLCVMYFCFVVSFNCTLDVYSLLIFLLYVCVCVCAIQNSCKLTQHETGDTFSLLGQRVGLEVINSRGAVHYQKETKKGITKIHKNGHIYEIPAETARQPHRNQ